MPSAPSGACAVLALDLQVKGLATGQKKKFEIPRDDFIELYEIREVRKVLEKSWLIDLEGFQDALSSVGYFNVNQKLKRDNTFTFLRVALIKSV